MKKPRLLVLAALALALGIVLPIAVYNLVGQRVEMPRPTPIPVYIPVLPGEQPSSGIVQEPRFVEGLRVFESYGSLSSFLKIGAGFRVALNKLTSLPSPVSTFPVWENIILEILPSNGKQGLRETPPVSKTNVQVEGVDEPDFTKTNGRIVVVASGSNVYIVGTREKAVLSVVSADGAVKGLFLLGDVLVLLVESRTTRGVVPDVDCKCFYVPPGVPLTAIQVYSLEDPAKPVLRGVVTVTGSMVSSRVREGVVYLVVSLPVDVGDVIPLVNGEAVPLETVYAVDDKPEAYTVVIALDLGKLEYTVHTFLTGGVSWLYMSHSRLYVARDSRYTLEDAYEEVLLTMARFLPEDLGESVAGMVREGRVDEAILLVRKYLAGVSVEDFRRFMNAVREELSRCVRKPETVFYVFRVEGVRVELEGLFKLHGQLLDQFAMEEYRGVYFVVATTERQYVVEVEAAMIAYPDSASSWSGSEKAASRTIRVVICRDSSCSVYRQAVSVPAESFTTQPVVEPLAYFAVFVRQVGETSNSVFVVDLDKLEVIGSVSGLAPGERVFAARLVKDVFFLVTARDVDPLFAIDLSKPENPVVLGYLKLPGFSEYLHPLPGDRLLGVGVDGPSDLKISLFDVSDPVNMREVAKIKLIPGWSPALRTHHAVTVYLERNTVFIPYSYWSTTPTSGVLAVKFTENSLNLDAVLEHPHATRTLYVGDEVYTVSEHLIRVFDLNTYEKIAEIPLKQQ